MDVPTRVRLRSLATRKGHGCFYLRVNTVSARGFVPRDADGDASHVVMLSLVTFVTCSQHACRLPLPSYRSLSECRDEVTHFRANKFPFMRDIFPCPFTAITEREILLKQRSSCGHTSLHVSFLNSCVSSLFPSGFLHLYSSFCPVSLSAHEVS